MKSVPKGLLAALAGLAVVVALPYILAWEPRGKTGGTAVEGMETVALTSALRDRPIPQGMLAIGEVGLAGEVRSVIRLEDRVREAERLGFTHCLVPASSLKGMDTSRYSIRITGVKDVVSALRAVAAAEKSAGAPER